jgi:hypothetical protein
LQKLYNSLLKKLDKSFKTFGDRNDDVYMSKQEAKEFQSALMTLCTFAFGGQRAQLILEIRTEVTSNLSLQICNGLVRALQRSTAGM